MFLDLLQCRWAAFSGLILAGGILLYMPDSAVWVGPDGVLHEPYLYLVLPGFLLILIGIVGLLISGIMALLRLTGRRKQRS